MGTPFDVAAGAAGVVSLGILLMQGCVQGFILLSTAHNFGQDADLVRCEIEFEQYRLFRWADKVGLENDCPNRNLNWAVINDVLKQLDALMNDTAKFKKEYGLEVITLDEKLSSDDLQIPKTGVRRLLACMKPDFHNHTSRRLHLENKVWRRLKWAVIDKDGIEMLVNDIRRKVDKLYDLLQDDDQKFIKKGIEALLRHAVSQSNISSDLSTIEQLLHPKATSPTRSEEHAIKTALSLKKRRLMLDLGDGKQLNTPSSSTLMLASSGASSTARSTSPLTSVSSPKTRTPRAPLSSRLLKRIAHSRQDVQTREMASYDGILVLVEWKRVERGVESKLKHRIKSLAALLEEMDSSSFHSLNCLGYLKDQGSGSYGYVFRTPAPGLKAFTALAGVFDSGRSAPSLNDRFTLAIALTETVLQLHTSGWLHKSIRSDNVLFFLNEGQSLDLEQAFLGGYEYARADNPTDMTELPEMQQELNLYRHPALLKANRASFQKSFDLYALGCVLVEIGLWRSLTRTLLCFLRAEKTGATFPLATIELTASTYNGKSEMAEVNNAKFILLTALGDGSIKQALEFAMGRTFSNVISLCLTASDKSGLKDDEDENDQCIDLELEILDKLRSCRI